MLIAMGVFILYHLFFPTFQILTKLNISIMILRIQNSDSRYFDIKFLKFISNVYNIDCFIAYLFLVVWIIS